jgi:phosphatidyl-myo-inositol dimannoside synthase
VYDDSYFRGAFFDDYRSVFDQVIVVARGNAMEAAPAAADRVDSEDVKFILAPDRRGARHVASFRKVGRHVERGIAMCDVACIRLPSVLGSVAADACAREGIPFGFELVGDAEQAFRHAVTGPVGLAVGKYFARRTRTAVAHAVAGSYVSARHLQRAYPVRAGTPTYAISSVRLNSDELSAHRQLDSTPHPVRMIYVGQLLPYKRPDVLISVVRELTVRHGIASTLDLVGGGPLHTELEIQARQEGVSQHVHFHGHVADRGALLALLDHADVFVMASATEGLPRAMIEALARGLPAVGTPIDAIEELLPADQIARTNSSQDIAATIAGLVTDVARLQDASVQAIKTASAYLAPVLSERRREFLATIAASDAGRAIPDSRRRPA